MKLPFNDTGHLNRNLKAIMEADDTHSTAER